MLSKPFYKLKCNTGKHVFHFSQAAITQILMSRLSSFIPRFQFPVSYVLSVNTSHFSSKFPTPPYFAYIPQLTSIFPVYLLYFLSPPSYFPATPPPLSNSSLPSTFPPPLRLPLES